MSLVTTLLAVAGPATANDVTDEFRFMGLGLLLLYPICINRLLNKEGRIPTQFIILISGLFIVPIFGNAPLKESDQFIHIMHLISLNLILFTSGLDTKFSSVRPIFGYGIAISTLGIAISTAITGGLLYLVISNQLLNFNNGVLGVMPLSVCMLIGASISSTDAGATISILKKIRTKLPEKIPQIIKFESSINDPAAVIVFGVVESWILYDASLGSSIDSTTELNRAFNFHEVINNLVTLFSTGTIVGAISGFLAIWAIKNLNPGKQQFLSIGIAVVSIIYAVSNYLGGSGLISAFIAGAILNNFNKSSRLSVVEDMKESVEPFSELAETFIYCSFAARIDPESLLRTLPWGILCCFIMMAIARPVSIYAFQSISRLNWKESSLIGWCGLKGAVTLALSFEAIDAIINANVFDNASTISAAQDIQSIIFITAVSNLLIQGLSIPSMAIWAAKNKEVLQVKK